jgi:hypothetical protein
LIKTGSEEMLIFGMKSIENTKRIHRKNSRENPRENP